MNPHEITSALEESIAKYTGAPYCVCVDNESNALFMALKYEGYIGEVIIPSHTYPSVPCEIINAGARVDFDSDHENLRDLNENEISKFEKFFEELGNPQWKENNIRILTGEYQLKPTRVWDSALTFTADMYRKGQFQCLSFTGQWKHLKTVKGGAILTDSEEAYRWFKRFRFSGRRECSYHIDTFDMIGHNYYMPHTLASIGLQMMSGFYNINGSKRSMPDISLPYPDLSRFPIYLQKWT